MKGDELWIRDKSNDFNITKYIMDNFQYRWIHITIQLGEKMKKVKNNKFFLSKEEKEKEYKILNRIFKNSTNNNQLSKDLLDLYNLWKEEYKNTLKKRF